MELGLIYMLISVAAYSLYAVSLKSAKDRIIVFFWVNIFAYIGYLGLYWFRRVILENSPHPIETLLYDFTFTNIPFYLLMAIFWVGSLIVLNHLLDNYDVSLVIPVTETSILFSTLGYLSLGHPFHWISIASVSIVFCGALISAFDTLSLKHPLRPLFKIPHFLIIGGLLQALLYAGTQTVSYLCTSSTIITQEILDWMINITRHKFQFPFAFHDPFYYNVGVRFFITVVFLVYIIGFKKMGNKIFTVLYKHFLYIFGISFAFLASITTNHAASFLFEDKTVLSALSKLSIPLILFIGHMALKEKVTQPKLVGCAIILLGGLINFL